MEHRSQVFAFLLLMLQLDSEGLAAKFTSAGAELVVEGSAKDFICEADNNDPIYDCIFTVPGFFTKIKIFDGFKNEIYEFVGDGFSKGQCGLRLLSINRSNSGSVGCSLVVGDEMAHQEEAAIDLTVLFPIDRLIFESNSIDGLYEYKENETMEFKCTAEGGYPPPTKLSLRIGGKIVKSTSEQRVVTWKRGAELGNNGELVVCSAEQANFSTPTVEETRLLTIFYAPRLQDGSNEVEKQVIIGERMDVTFNILANRPPFQYELTKNGEARASNISKEKRKTITKYTWSIMTVSESDLGEWNLFVRNDYGSTNVTIKLKQAPGAAKFTSAGTELVVEGSAKDLICEADNNDPIYECIFTVPGFFTKIKIFDGFKNETYEFVGDGFSKGQCGLRLLSINRSNSGSVGCSLVVGDEMAHQEEAAIDLTVLFPIDRLIFESNSIDGLYEYKENETMEFKCTAEGGYPPPTKLSLRIGGKIVKSTSEQRVVTWKRGAEIGNNGELVVCSAEQANFSTPTVEETRRLTIFYAPRPQDGLNEVEKQVIIGERMDVTFNILANRPPFQYELTKNGEARASNISEEKGNTTAKYTWTIMTVSESDLGEWNLFVRNNYGSTNVTIKLKQAPDLEDTSIMGIIFGVLIALTMILLIVAVVWCKFFRAGSAERQIEHETSIPLSAILIPVDEQFQKPFRMVSGEQHLTRQLQVDTL